VILKVPLFLLITRILPLFIFFFVWWPKKAWHWNTRLFFFVLMPKLLAVCMVTCIEWHLLPKYTCGVHGYTLNIIRFFFFTNTRCWRGYNFSPQKYIIQLKNARCRQPLCLFFGSFYRLPVLCSYVSEGIFVAFQLSYIS